jgi:purine-binding chemotaxis protein CheW
MTDIVDAPDRSPTGPADMAGRYLTLVINGETFALNINDITEILAYRKLTTVPMMPSFVPGVLNLRGRVVPVVDMAARFGRGTTALARRTGIVIVETAGRSPDGGVVRQDIGIMVDGVNEVVHLDEADIEAPPAFGAGIRADFIAGMAKRNGAFTILLDIDHVLSMTEMIALGEAAARGGDPQRSGRVATRAGNGATS